MADQPGHLPDKPPTLSMLHLPAGGVLVMIYLMALVRMEELTGLPTRVLFPAVDAASGGAPITAALYGPKPMSAKDALEGFYAGASRFYPPRDNRLAKMFVAHGIHTIQEQID